MRFSVSLCIYPPRRVEKRTRAFSPASLVARVLFLLLHVSSPPPSPNSSFFPPLFPPLFPPTLVPSSSVTGRCCTHFYQFISSLLYALPRTFRFSLKRRRGNFISRQSTTGLRISRDYGGLRLLEMCEEKIACLFY